MASGKRVLISAAAVDRWDRELADESSGVFFSGTARGSDSAFHTESSLSPPPAAISATPLLTVLSYQSQHVTPAGPDAFAVLWIDHADGTMPKRDFAPPGNRFDLDFKVVVGWIRHEERAAQFQQSWRLDDLHKSPQVSDPKAPVTVPPSTRLRLEQQLQ
jgi:hypothetical protein